MPPQFPGINISVLRQRTFARPNEPLTISGRVTALGFGVPALVRVFVEGPQHNPEVRSFDTIASPISGDYSTSVLAEKEGSYVVYAQAFPPVAVPVPGAPDPVFLGPPLAESPRPPLAIGVPVNGGVELEVAPGRRERVAPPAPTTIEVRAPITFAPRIEVPVTAPARRVVAPVPVTPGETVPEAPALVEVTPTVSGRITSFEVE